MAKKKDDKDTFNSNEDIYNSISCLRYLVYFVKLADFCTIYTLVGRD